MKLKKMQLLLFLSTSVFFLQAQNINFNNLASLSNGRSAISSANDGENIYVVNGFTTTEQFTSNVLKYDIALDLWSELTALTSLKRFVSTAILGDNLYVFNGFLDNGTLNNKLEIINLTTSAITMGADNPLPVQRGGVSVWNNKIYAFGGKIATNVYNDKVYEYNPQNDSWIEITQMPIGQECKGEIINGKLYIIGGYNGIPSDKIEIYDIDLNTWETALTLPITVSANTTAIVGSKIFSVGDFTDQTLIVGLETTDLSFEVYTNNMNARRNCGAEGVNDKLYLIGGNTESNITSSIASVQVSDNLLATENFVINEDFEFYPNPTKEILHFNLELDLVTIFDSNGKLINTYKGKINQIDVMQYQDGIYFLHGRSNNKWYQSKWIK